ncbi:MAG TPA: NADPH:quinone oxidoreductase family protein [Acidimicrobiales bacterium]|jgi:NADPH2:quinone reductase|nr:NADPH:quinone oxidoreductase family protein [Acidimicrobiales bacterium]
MRAVVCKAFGPVENLEIEERPDPMPGDRQVVLDVEAAGVNFVDALFVQGQYQIKPPTPFVPGSEVAGTIRAVGNGVEDSRVGERVLVSSGLGGFADQLVADTSAAIAIPDVLDAPRAATFTQSFCTALFSLRDRLDLQAGERLLVLGAGGGVGLATIQVAKALGATVAGAASTGAKRDLAAAAGADLTIDTSLGTDHLKSAAREWAGGQLDAVIDPVGGELAEPALRALGNGGRFGVIGFASGTIASLPTNQILLRNRSVVGVDWGAWALQHPREQATLLGDLLHMVEQGNLLPVAPSTRPLTDVAGVLRELLDRQVAGKVALVP